MTHDRILRFHPGTEFPASPLPVLAKTTDGWFSLERYHNKWYNSDTEAPYRVEDTYVLFWAYTPELP
jgi:hypothetical protein